MEYDVVGDIHGNNEALETLLAELGYRRSRGSWLGPSDRQIIFVGDFVDRGPGQVEVISTVRSLMDSGHALAILGNHELNAIAWHRGFRPDSQKNRKQHQGFLEQVGERSDLHDELVDWFLTLPMWLDLSELRVVHACWHWPSIDVLQTRLADQRLTDDLIALATVGASNTIGRDGVPPNEHPVFSAVETLLKGIEVELPEGVSFLDKDKNRRSSVRVKWWEQPPATYGDVTLSPVHDLAAMATKLPEGVLPGYDEHKPCFIGHYWRRGRPELLSPRIACVDYSAGADGPLVAYCWRGEDVLNAENFRST
ncbi:metallophosphoesterase [Erythrobacter aurantius]|uniref:metallophosphoesterase n=1 Tax=Erythrobacter aurantius TaxID=2909249 RepID=UPI0020792E89|nr:metallophosphoesterase [Erythrobacter aurantius]